MNETRKEKLKSLILKLPFGLQLLKLRRKIILRHERKKQMKIKCYKKMVDHKIANIRNSAISQERKVELLNQLKLQNKYYYYQCSVENLRIFRHYSQVPSEQATAFEIGAGEQLFASIGLSCLGFGKVITVDIRRAEPKYVQAVVKYYQKHGAKLGMIRRPKIKEMITDKNLDRILLNHFNIDYRAPYDAARTDLPDNSVDYIFTHSTFEHIRAEILPDIIKESFRILRGGGGIAYIAIDFKAHRSYLNPKLSIYDYLQYTTAEWPQHDSKSHQNRLRTADYQKMFIDAGFEVVSLHKQKITDADRAAFATVKVADEFKNKYTDEELMEKGAWFVLRKPIK